MKKLVGVVIASTLGLVGLAGPAAAVTGSQRFTVTFSRETGKVFASGVIHGVGTDVELSTTDNPDGSTSGVDLFTFRRGTLTVAHSEDPAQFSFDSRTCVGRFSFTGTYTITGGTGAYAGASGSGTDVGSGVFVAARNPDGSCSETEEAFDIVVVRLTGTLTLPAQAAA